MKRIIVSDSSSNVFRMQHAGFVSVPMKIIAGETEYVDTPELDVVNMINELREYKGKSGTACPSVGDWYEAFQDADEVFCIALTSKISGCYNAAMIAKQQYEDEYPDKKVFVLDTLSTGPEQELIVIKLSELVNTNKSFEKISEEITEYAKHTHLMFSLESLSNFAKNGRVKPAVAKVASLLGIRIVGQASMEGELEPMHKCRGEKSAITELYNIVIAAGYNGGRMVIRHTYNPEMAQKLADKFHEVYADAEIKIAKNKGLCAYYAETGGVLIGFEGAKKEAQED